MEDTVDDDKRNITGGMIVMNEIKKDHKDYGRVIYPELRYCTRCCYPDTTEGLFFDEYGVCSACVSSEQKMRIDWSARKEELKSIMKFYKNKNNDNYDCIVPISGGKDSAFQLHVVAKEFGMRVLAVTFNHTWYSETGKYNLRNILDKLNIDHVMFHPNRRLIDRLAKKAIHLMGDPCWHCHAGVGAYPLQVAVQYKIPFMIWGESAAEGTGKATYDENVEFDAEYFFKMSSKIRPEKFVGDGITMRDLQCFVVPEIKELEAIKLKGIHLGDYLFWDGEKQKELMVEEYEWREDDVSDTYKKYPNVECWMPGIRDYCKWMKRGFGRMTDHVCMDVRAGLMTREEGFELIRKYNGREPKGMDTFLKVMGMTREELDNALRNLRTGSAKKLSY